jgi:hypothetical protein
MGGAVEADEFHVTCGESGVGMNYAEGGALRAVAYEGVNALR